MSELCHFCGGPMVWDSDAEYNDIYDDPAEGLVAFCHCDRCGATATWVKKEDHA